MADHIGKIVAASEHANSRYRRKRLLKKGLSTRTAQQKFIEAGFYFPQLYIYDAIFTEKNAGRFTIAAKYLIDFLSKNANCNYYNYLCRRLFFQTPVDGQIIIWQEIARYHTINFCGVDKDAQKELIARKLATTESFKCQSICYGQDVATHCNYCGAEFSKDFIDKIVYIKNPSRGQLLTIFMDTLRKSCDGLQLLQVKHEIELHWPDLSLVPCEITSLLSIKIMIILINIDYAEYEIWQLFLWGLDKFHYNFITTRDTLDMFIRNLEYFKTPEATCNFILSHFPRRILEDCDPCTIIEQYLDNTTGTGRRTKAALRTAPQTRPCAQAAQTRPLVAHCK